MDVLPLYLIMIERPLSPQLEGSVVMAINSETINRVTKLLVVALVQGISSKNISSGPFCLHPR